MSKTGYVYFWRETSDHGCFSNWYEAPFVIDGTEYRWVEQYMMSKKALLFGDEVKNKKIMEASDPNECKALGRKVKPFDPALWDEKKFDIVYEGNKETFEQNSDIKEILLATGDDILVEASPFDKIWGIGLGAKKAREIPPEEWPGENLLRKALMRVREDLRR